MNNKLDTNLERIEINNTKNIRDIAYEMLRKAILDGAIETGERIVEKDYAEKLNISRTPIREAIRRLESEGLVQYIPRKGVIAKGLSLEDIEEIYEIRKALECLAVRQLILNLDDNILNKLKLVRLKMYEIEKTGSIEELYKESNDLHKEIIESCSMPRLKKLIENLQEYYYNRATESIESRWKEAIKEHIAIYEAVLNKDIKAAQEFISIHSDNSKKVLFYLYGGN